MASRPNIATVAERARVAASTVSRVLNGGYASEDTRARVQKAVEELGYIRSPTAKSLRLGRAGCLGVVVETSQGPWFTQLLGGIEEQLIQRDESVLLGSLALKGSYDIAAVERWIAERRVDGVIFARPGKRERPLVRLARKAGLPAVFVTPDENIRGAQTFRADNHGGGLRVAEHLLELGHRRVAFIGGPKESVDTLDRLEGLREGLSAGGVRLRKSDVRFARSYVMQDATPWAERWSAQSRGDRPTAVVMGNDSLAIGFMRTVQQKGARVPEDVSVVGFDGVPESAYYWPGLTTCEQPTGQMGHDACQALVARIDQDGEARAPGKRYPMRLQVRESTGRPRG